MKISVATFSTAAFTFLFGLLSTMTNAADAPSFGVDKFVNLFRPAIRKTRPESSFITLKFWHEILQSKVNFVELTATATFPEEPFSFGILELNVEESSDGSIIMEALSHDSGEILIDLSNIFEIHFTGLDLSTLDLEILQNIMGMYCNRIVKVALSYCIIESISFLKSIERLNEIHFTASAVMHLFGAEDLVFPLVELVVWNTCLHLSAEASIANIKLLWENGDIRQLMVNYISEGPVLQMLQLFPSLTTLALTINNGALRNLVVLSEIPTITKLYLFPHPGNHTIKIENLDLLISALPNLKELILQNMNTVDFAEARGFSLNTTTSDHPFKRLCIYGCFNIPQLHSILLIDTNTVILNAENLPKFEKKFKNLEKIGLNECAMKFDHILVVKHSTLNALMPNLTKTSLNVN